MEMVAPDCHFDADYCEGVTLRDGSEVVLRLLTPQDKAQLVAGHARLSEKSRYMRFFSSKDHLSDAELRYLTEIDQVNHFALGAVRIADDGSEQGLGVARFVRDADDPEVADPAVAVIDAMHRKGLGRLLLMRLIAAARERGLIMFRADVLADNIAMRRMLHELAPDGVTDQELADGCVIMKLLLPSVDADEPLDSLHWQGPIYRVLRWCAEEALHVGQVLQILPRDDSSKPL